MNVNRELDGVSEAQSLGRLADRYEIQGVIGSGGMAAVYQGRDLVLDRVVAIKLLPRDKREQERAGQRLLREARAMARIAHPGIVQVFDHGSDATLGPYLVMERLYGENLARFLHGRGPLPLDLALSLIEQICAALQAAHDAGVVHRDLKPSNLFVVRGPTPDAPRIKVLDFGVAKLDDAEQLTDPGDILGTLAYLPPERWEGGETGDARADVYALGAILYELLSDSTPFRAQTRAALRLSILHDEAIPLTEVRPELPSSLSFAVARALSKSPALRFQSAWEFALALGIPLQRLDAGAGGGPPFDGTARYRVLRALATGQGTEIYAAWDVEQRRPVALKRVLRPSGEALARLKREVRALCDVQHRNVVRAHDFLEHGEYAILVLELVEGTPLLDHLQRAPGDLQACVSQLVHALAAVHARGLVHGDVAPQNVLVEPAGRLVLLDCGLSSRARSRATPRGTLDYLAPEVLEGHLGPEADFYALGLLLCRALTGELPSAAPKTLAFSEWLSSHGQAEWPRALSELCVELLNPDPVQRVDEAKVLARLGVAREARGPGADNAKLGAEFVGRDVATRELWQAFQRSAEGTSTVVWLEGTSGIGKTTLIEHFGRTLERQGRALVLRSRARHSAAIPFPAFDELIDELSEWLAAQAPATLSALLPRGAEHLARLFPVLLRVPALSRSASGTPASKDTAQLRLDATDALRELLRRLCQRQPLVLLIDDVQWLDADSADLVAAVLGGPEAPALLLIGAVRSEDGELGTALRKLESRLREPGRRVLLDPLSHEESRALLRARWRGDTPLDDETALRLARQSGGIPFFADLLAAGPVSPGTAASGGLDGVLHARQQRLPASSRLALELLCVSSRPLRRAVLARAAGDDPRVLGALLTGCFARAVHTSGSDALEPYHARIRETVLQSLSSAARAAHHRALALILREDAQTEPEALVEHLAGCGEVRQAADLALSAAQIASEQLAFDRAAALFGVALEHGLLDPARAQDVRRRRARALHDAGRRRQAGQELLGALDLSSDEAERRALEREAGSHLLLSGDAESGLAALKPAILHAGLTLPETPAEMVSATLGALGALAARGVSPSTVISERAADFERIDLCLLLAQGLAHVDLRALPFAILSLHAALDAGESERLQRASAVFVVSTVGHVPNPLTAPALELCRRLTSEVRTPYARALLHAAEAEMALSQGSFLAAEANFERAERTLLESCAGATRELAVVRDMAVFSQYAHKGDFRTQLSRTQRWLRAAEETQDQFHTSMLRVAHAIVWVAHDQPERARAELDRAEAEWTYAAGILVVVATLYRDIADRYTESECADPEARAQVLASPAAGTPFLAGYVELHAVWTALRRIARAGSAAVTELRLTAESLARLRSFGLDVWLAVADALEANLDFLHGARASALHRLEEAEQTFRRLHMLCLAACARKRRGQFTQAELGARLQLEADAELRQLGVVDIERWSRAYWSIFEADAAEPLTYVNEPDSGAAASGAA